MKHDKWKLWLEQHKKSSGFNETMSEYRKMGKDYLLIPDEDLILRPFNFEDIEDIKVVMTDYKPTIPSYAADGLAWSSLDLPSSRDRLLYKKLQQELGITFDQTDNRKDKWASQGILLLNMNLGVLEGSDHPFCWGSFTIPILEYFIKDNQPRAFLFLDWTITLWHQLPQNKKHETHYRDLTDPDEFHKPLFSSVNDFIARHYSVDLDWS